MDTGINFVNYLQAAQALFNLINVIPFSVCG